MVQSLPTLNLIAVLHTLTNIIFRLCQETKQQWIFVSYRVPPVLHKSRELQAAFLLAIYTRKILIPGYNWVVCLFQGLCSFFVPVISSTNGSCCVIPGFTLHMRKQYALHYYTPDHIKTKHSSTIFTPQVNYKKLSKEEDSSTSQAGNKLSWV